LADRKRDGLGNLNDESRVVVQPSAYPSNESQGEGTPTLHARTRDVRGTIHDITRHMRSRSSDEFVDMTLMEDLVAKAAVPARVGARVTESSGILAISLARSGSTAWWRSEWRSARERHRWVFANRPVVRTDHCRQLRIKVVYVGWPLDPPAPKERDRRVAVAADDQRWT
jgi:hypothetical protein